MLYDTVITYFPNHPQMVYVPSVPSQRLRRGLRGPWHLRSPALAADLKACREEMAMRNQHRRQTQTPHHYLQDLRVHPRPNRCRCLHLHLSRQLWSRFFVSLPWHRCLLRCCRKRLPVSASRVSPSYFANTKDISLGPRLRKHEKSYQVKDPLTNLNHPGEGPDVLSIPQAGVEPREIGCCSLICH